LARFAGKRVNVTTHEPHEGRRHFEGELLGPDELDRLGVRLDEGVEHRIAWSEVRSARLVVDPWADATGDAARGKARRPARRGRGGVA
jgi:ribosome maturation factor RimP